MYDSVTNLNFGGQQQQRAFVTFFMEKEANNFRSEQEGRAVYDDVEYVRIITPGDTRSEVVRAATPDHKREYSQQYAAFKAGVELAPVGSPLEHWPPASPALIANLKAVGVHTVEQLSEVSDGNLMNLGHGGRGLRERAKAWLEQADGGKPIDRLLAENERLKQDAEVRDGTIAAMQAQLTRLERLMAQSSGEAA